MFVSNKRGIRRCLIKAYLFFLREITAAADAAPRIAKTEYIGFTPVLGASVLLFVVVAVFIVVEAVAVVVVAVVVVVVVFVSSSPSWVVA